MIDTGFLSRTINLNVLLAGRRSQVLLKRDINRPIRFEVALGLNPKNT